MSAGKTVLGICAVGIALVMLVQCNRSQIASNSAAAGGVSSTSTSTVSTADSASPVSKSPQWDYSDETDEMSGARSSYAQLASVDSFTDDMGMKDAATTKLEIQRKGKNHYVAISNPNLQFTCSAFTETYVRVKFDNGPPHTFPCTEEKTSKYGVAFILNAPKFISSLKKAKHVVIEAEVFQRGMKTMHWDVPPLSLS
jgi:hypothetical protein